MARESRPPNATPTQRASTAEPTPTISRLSVLQTPGSQARGLQRPQGLSASGRKIAPPTATPHARAAFRTIDSRRAAIFTPHRARRQSVREARDSPRDFLLSLGKVLAKTTEPITTSSSSPRDDTQTSPKGSGSDDAQETTLGLLGMDYDDDDDADLPKRPRLSLPIDEDDEDDSDDLMPHRSVVIDDDNFTMQSIEMPRRAYSEQPNGRLSMSTTRMSDFFNTNDLLHSEDVGIDSAFFPQITMDEENFTMPDFASPERIESESGRRNTGGDSDFGIQVPLDLDENTFVIAPEVQDSPSRAEAELDQPVFEEYAPLEDQRSDSYGGDMGDLGDLGELPDMEEEEPDPTRSHVHDETETETLAAKRAELRASKKKGINISRHGIEYPSLPAGVVKRIAQNFAKTSGAKGKITPDAMKTIMQASEWFFEQLGADLEAYAKHAGRKTIDESDVLTLMKRVPYRQRQVNSHTTPFALAQRHLPRELLQDLRMAPPPVSKKRRKAASGAEDESGT
ncbi:centromere kinetochore component CENP-T-domain-containing protein [Podospora australis]|uniref:Centromere kinetochore component CENP-T-domain-containing protein n=1 Tax=Podospora australis TaxID=1536484 RepID=A0AAN6X235_9PEZI|nr:centromere kinetochore component CENP-T-domain-containing protein [Podospora australis]